MEQTELRSRARAALRTGAERAGARAHFRAMGIDPARLDGPIVGVVSTWTGTMPCNLNHRELSVAACDARRGGRRRAAPVQHDRRLGQPVARDARDARIADLARGDRRLDRADGERARLRRARLHRRLRQDVPAALMALARVDRPAVVLYSGPMRAGTLGGPRGDDPGRVGGGRRRGARADVARGARRARGGRVSRAGDVRRATSPRTRWPSRSSASGSRTSATGSSRPTTWRRSGRRPSAPARPRSTSRAAA